MYRFLEMVPRSLVSICYILQLSKKINPIAVRIETDEYRWPQNASQVDG